MITDAELDHFEVLAKLATPGPWQVDLWDNDMRAWAACGPTHGPDIGDDGVVEDNERVEARALADAHFIAAARDGLPRLVAEVRRLREQVAILRDAYTEEP